MRILRLTISRKILLLVGFVSLISGLAGILPLYLGSFVALERSFSNLLITSTQSDASLLNKYLTDLDSQFKLVSENFLQHADSALAAYATAEELKEISAFKPLDLRANREFGSQYEALLNAAGSRGYLCVVNSRGRVCANSRDVFSLDLANQGWWMELAALPPTALYFAQIDEVSHESGSPATYLLMIKPLLKPTGDGGSDFSGAIVLALDVRDMFQRAIGMNSLRQVNNILMSDDGRVIFQPTGAPSGIAKTIVDNLPDVLNNATGWYWADVPGSRMLLAHSAVNLLRLNARQGRANAEWFVVEYIDVSEPIAQNSYHLWRTIPLGLLLIGLLCLLGAAISYRIVKPLKNLQRGVERLRRGDLDHRVEVRTTDELESLAESFNRMAQTLQETYAELEFKIRETDEKRNQLAIINEVIKATTQALDADRSFRIIANEVGRVVPYDRMSLSTINEERDEVEFVFVIPENRQALPKGHKVPLKESIISLAVSERTPLVQELRHDSHPDFSDAQALYEAGARSILIVPLIAQEGIVGSLNLASERTHQFGEREISMILQVADTMAVSIEHANLYTRVARFAEELEAKVKQRTAALENAQQKLIQTEKFAATGRLAANIAHEINNPLGIIKNYLYLLSENVEHSTAAHGGEEDARENLRIIREEIDRIARIVRRLLDFYKRPDIKPIPTDVNREIEEMFYLTRKGFKRKDITVEKELADNLPTIMASPDKVRQVVLNLLRNAEDAASDKGRILITTKLERLQDDRTGQTNDYVVVTVSDNGCGISPENMRQIFDPFFTTKQESGTGLGLSITYGIVESLGGWIEVESEEGEGATFRVILPVEPVEIPAAPRIKEAPPLDEVAPEGELAAAAAVNDSETMSITLGGKIDEQDDKTVAAAAQGKPPAPEEPEHVPFDELATAGLTFGDTERKETVAPSAKAAGPSFTGSLPRKLSMPSLSEPPPQRPGVHLPPREHVEPAWPKILESLDFHDAGDSASSIQSSSGLPATHKASEALDALDMYFNQHGFFFLDYGNGDHDSGSVGAEAGAAARSMEPSLYDELFGDTSMPQPAPPAKAERR